jgi:hypothetical protein
VSVTVKHHIFGHCTFEVLVEKNDDCTQCVHARVCSNRVNEFCDNYCFGTSADTGCHGCVHRYTRWDADPIPCFKCRYFSPKGPPANG